MAIEIVDFPSKMVIFHGYVSSPEGILHQVFGCFCAVKKLSERDELSDGSVFK